MDSANANLIGILCERASMLQQSGNLAEAHLAANAALTTAQQYLDTDLASVDAYVACLERRGDILNDLGQTEEARDDYKEALDLFEHRPDKFADMGRLHAGIGASWDLDGNDQMAAEHWIKASDYFERNDPPLLIDVAAMANNLGFLNRQAGNLEQAETHFLRALEIAHSQLGQEHEQTATISSNLGALYQASGHHQQAREMHMMALESRRNLFGEEHPDTAQSHNNLALALLQTGDRSWARRHFEKALAAFEILGADYAEDLDAVADNYCEFLRSEGEEQLAEVIAGRVSEVLAG
jgi:tetratricopeptide (TPR) repeat protein